MMDLTVAPRLPGYRDLTPLGQGGYSEVYRAYQEQFDRWVAVKVLTFALTDERSRSRFLRECQVAGRVSSHPHIATVYDAGLAPSGRPYIAMELCEGGSVADQLRSAGPFPVAKALRIGVAVAGALESAHRAGVVHRDVKPGNVLLTGYGQPALTDFGLSVVSEHHEVTAGADALSPYYAPPEVLSRAQPTPVSDVYALASTVYTMLASRPPHQLGPGEALASLLARIVQVDVPPVGRPDVPRSLDVALLAALARDPGVRTPSALAFAVELGQVQAELGLEVTAPIVLDPQRAPEPSHIAFVGPDMPVSGTPDEDGETTIPDIAFVGPDMPVSGTPDRGGASAAAGETGEVTVHRSKVPGPWPPAPTGRTAPRRARRRAAVVAGAVLAVAVAGGGVAYATTGAGGGESAGGATTTTSPTTAPTSTTQPPGTTAPPTTAPPTTAPPTTAPPAPADLPVADVSASATAPDSTDGCGDPTDYGAANAVDGANDTGWAIEGDGTGESLTIQLDGEHQVSSVGLLPGFDKVDSCSGTDRFPENRRPTSVTWRFDDGTEVSQELGDAREVQTLDVDATTSTIEMRIDGVTSDPRRDFTVVSEIAVQGT
jgi:serine/threonine-protein kinase PknK